MKLLELQQKLSPLKCFTPREVKLYTGLSDTSASMLLSRYVKKGILEKLRNGYYIFKAGAKPSLWLIANKVYAPSYISFETALSFYGMIPETVYSTISATPKTTRTFWALSRELVYHKIKQDYYTGYKATKVGEDIIMMAEPEKALTDYLYFVFLKRKELSERLKLTGINRKVFAGYAGMIREKGFSDWSNNVIKRINK